MKIAYGTYALPQMSLEEAFPTLAEIGYDGVELFIGPKHVGAMLDDFITVEVSTLIWARDDYDPMAAAAYSYETLSAAFEEAGVART